MGNIYNKAHQSSLNLAIGSVDTMGDIYDASTDRLMKKRIGEVASDGTIYRLDDPSYALTTKTRLGYVTPDGEIHEGSHSDLIKSTIGYIDEDGYVYKGARGLLSNICVGYIEANSIQDFGAAAFFLLLNDAQNETVQEETSDHANTSFPSFSIAVLIAVAFVLIAFMTMGPVGGIILGVVMGFFLAKAAANRK